jgi:hypothetical protein
MTAPLESPEILCEKELAQASRNQKDTQGTYSMVKITLNRKKRPLGISSPDLR